MVWWGLAYLRPAGSRPTGLRGSQNRGIESIWDATVVAVGTYSSRGHACGCAMAAVSNPNNRVVGGHSRLFQQGDLAPDEVQRKERRTPANCDPGSRQRHQPNAPRPRSFSLHRVRTRYIYERTNERTNERTKPDPKRTLIFPSEAFVGLILPTSPQDSAWRWSGDASPDIGTAAAPFAPRPPGVLQTPPRDSRNPFVQSERRVAPTNNETPASHPGVLCHERPQVPRVSQARPLRPLHLNRD